MDKIHAALKEMKISYNIIDGIQIWVSAHAANSLISGALTQSRGNRRGLIKGTHLTDPCTCTQCTSQDTVTHQLVYMYIYNMLCSYIAKIMLNMQISEVLVQV